MELSTLASKYRNWQNSDQKLRKLVVSVKYHLFKSRMWREAMALDNKGKFTLIYKHNLWNNEESLSGGGSTLKRTSNIRNTLPKLIAERGFGSVLDAGCGDFHWMKNLTLGARYIGGDIVKDLVDDNQRKYGGRDVSFIELDITRDNIPKVDLILCRECLFHLCFADIIAAFANFKRSGSRYMLITHYPDQQQNADIVSGLCSAINFRRPPFNLPEPIELIPENLEGQCLGLWRLEDLADHKAN
jgi:SAM-dependent methyltransferase